MSEIIRKNGNGRYSEAVIKDGILYVYYGAADKYVGVATCPLQELLDHLLQNKL